VDPNAVQTSRPVADGLFENTGGAPRLRAARCLACDELHFPAAPICPYCGREGTAPTLVGPGGTLRLFTVVATRPPGYRGDLPFGFGVVALEGTRLEVITRLTTADATRLRPGLCVTLAIVPLFTADDGMLVTTYAFAPAEPA
jgi:uncharacterized OB-fold protein